MADPANPPTPPRSSALVLLGATVAALLWANSPWSHSYADVWSHARPWVNEGLMALFFFVVGVEIKRELVLGELRDRRHAALPAFAALGGMVVPALIYLVATAGTTGHAARGWAIPMATDIAFALGVLAVLGGRLPRPLKVFLLTLAVVDDIGAIAVIALVYATDVHPAFLAAAAALLAAVVLLRAARVTFLPLYAILAVGVWAAVHHSGVHPTIAGVALGLVVPAAQSERFERVLNPVTSLFVLPLFALANAGVSLGVGSIAAAAGSPVTLGVVAGLVLGKPVGIGLAAWAAVRLRIGALPAGLKPRHIAGVALLAGIGFTVSLFVAGLAFTDARMVEEAKVGILLGSSLAALLGLSVLARS
jgi:NhaA family Na+:H+ antiporter